MIQLRVEPSARLSAQARNPNYTTTKDDLPTGTRMFYDVPRVGDGVEDPDTGESFTVERVVWWTDGTEPLIILG